MTNHLCLIIISSTLLIYLLLDGRALAMCLLIIFLNKENKAKVYNFILPSWDANQTWLVFSLAALYGAYSQVFGEFFSKHYLSLIAMLLFFLFRGAAIEFSLKEKNRKALWHGILAASSTIILAIQSFLVVHLLLMQQSFFLELNQSLSMRGVYMFSAVCFLFLLHISHALDSLANVLDKKSKLFLSIILGSNFLLCLILFNELSGLKFLIYWSEYLVALVFLWGLSYFVSHLFEKRSLRIFIGLLYLGSVFSVFYYLYPFRSESGVILLNQASSMITVKIIAVASIIILPCLMVAMNITSAVFSRKQDNNLLDY